MYACACRLKELFNPPFILPLFRSQVAAALSVVPCLCLYYALKEELPLTPATFWWEDQV